MSDIAVESVRRLNLGIWSFKDAMLVWVLGSSKTDHDEKFKSRCTTSDPSLVEDRRVQEKVRGK